MTNSTIDRPRQYSIRIGDVELEIFEGGQGRPILYLHAGGGFYPGAPFIEPLCRQFQMIAPSHPGFGHSALPLWMDSIDDFAHLYLELIEKMGLDEIILIGASIGGWIAAEMATKSTEHLTKIVLVAPVGIKVSPSDTLDIPDIFAMPKERLNELLYRDPQSGELRPDTKSDEELEIIARNRETLALVTWEPYMHNPKLKHRLHSISCPTLILRGETDGLVSQDYVSAYGSFIPESRTDCVQHAGHSPQTENPDEFVKKIVDFVLN